MKGTCEYNNFSYICNVTLARKAPGICGITGEMLKAGGDVVVQWLHRIFCVAWGSGTVPANWRKAQIVPVHKKGSRTQCKNYRGISLLSVPGKVYATVLDKRIRAITEGKVLEEQGAFQSKRSCIEQIFTVRQLGKKVIGKNKTMRMVCFREVWCQGEFEGSCEVTVLTK